MIVTINTMDDGEIGEISAKLCLTAATEYAEKHGLVIVGERGETGKVFAAFDSAHMRYTPLKP